jgi:phage terminase large subunit
MIKINPKYKSLFQNTHRYHLISGGRASGKSYTVALYLLLLTMEKDNVILFSRYTMTSVGISVFPEFIDKIETLGLTDLFEITNSEIINKQTGSKIIFKGIKTGSSIQTANLKSIANLNIVVIDEAEEIPTEEVFDKIDLSARRKDKFNKIILIFNPTSKAHWLYERFYESQGVEPGITTQTDDTNYIHTTYLDNAKHLSDSIIKQIEKIRDTNINKYNHIILGAFLDVAEGVIFTNWEYGEFNNDLEYGYGMDFGYNTDPTTLCKVAIDKKNMVIYLDEILYKPGLTTPQIYSMINGEVTNKLIVADNAEGRLIDELKKTGINIKACTKGAGSVAEGVKLLQDYKLVITKTSTNLAKELNNYIWHDKRSNTPIDFYNHLIDAIRYYVTDKTKNPTITKFKIR